MTGHHLCKYFTVLHRGGRNINSQISKGETLNGKSHTTHLNTNEHITAIRVSSTQANNRAPLSKADSVTRTATLPYSGETSKNLTSIYRFLLDYYLCGVRELTCNTRNEGKEMWKETSNCGVAMAQRTACGIPADSSRLSLDTFGVLVSMCCQKLLAKWFCSTWWGSDRSCRPVARTIPKRRECLCLNHMIAFRMC